MSFGNIVKLLLNSAIQILLTLFYWDIAVKKENSVKLFCVFCNYSILSGFFAHTLTVLKSIKLPKMFMYYQDPVATNKRISLPMFLQATSLLHPMIQGKKLSQASTFGVFIFISMLNPCVNYLRQTFNTQIF